MKKLLLSSLLGLFAIAAVAQPDISVTLDKPIANASLQAGVAFDWEITVKNESSTAITVNDSIINIPLFNGQPIPTAGGGIVGWIENAAIAAGATATFTHSLTLTGGTSGTINICGFAIMEDDSDSTNNMSCHDITWDATIIGIGELHEAVIENNSYVSNGVFRVALENVFNHDAANISIVNINGQVVLTENMDINTGIIEGDIDVTSLATGIYIVKFASPKGVISTQKVMIN